VVRRKWLAEIRINRAVRARKAIRVAVVEIKAATGSADPV
jgi:hypothetical protein